MYGNRISLIIIGGARPLAAGLASFLKKNADAIELHKVFFDGRNSNAAEFFKFQKAYYRETSGLLAPGEYGCLRSHMEAYRIVSEVARPCLIIEDDAIPRTFVTPKTLQSALSICRDHEVIHLGVQNGLSTYFPTSRGSIWELPKGFPIWRTAAYAIGPQAAYRLRGFQQENTRRADEWRVFTHAGILDLKYVDLFDHPVEKNHDMESERSGGDLNLRAELKKRMPAALKRRLMPRFLSRKIKASGILE